MYHELVRNYATLAVRSAESFGDSLIRPKLDVSSTDELALDKLVKLQLSAAPGAPSMTSALWKSPKSPKLSNDVSSPISSDMLGVKVKGSAPLAAAVSEKGPKASYFSQGLAFDTRITRRQTHIFKGIVVRRVCG